MIEDGTVIPHSRVATACMSRPAPGRPPRVVHPPAAADQSARSSSIPRRCGFVYSATPKHTNPRTRPGEMAKRAHYSASVLSRAASGRALPTLPATLAFVLACGGSREQWAARWHSVAATVNTAAHRPVNPDDPPGQAHRIEPDSAPATGG